MDFIYTRLAYVLNGEREDSIDYHIAHTLINHVNWVAEKSIGEVASLCDVSKSTLSKFVRKLGYEDYADFKWTAKRAKEKESYLEGKVNITDHVCEHGMDSYLSILMKDLKNQVAELPEETIRKIAELIHSSENIGAFGESYSEAAALNLQSKMFYYRKVIFTTLDDQKQRSYIEHADQNTLLIIFSNSGRYVQGYNFEDEDARQNQFRQTKGKVVLITSNEEMEHDPSVDVCLLYRHSTNVQNHIFLFQMIIEEIAAAYQKMYGFPQEKE